MLRNGRTLESARAGAVAQNNDATAAIGRHRRRPHRKAAAAADSGAFCEQTPPKKAVHKCEHRQTVSEPNIGVKRPSEIRSLRAAVVDRPRFPLASEAAHRPAMVRPTRLPD